jgi:hypothetical protein
MVRFYRWAVLLLLVTLCIPVNGSQAAPAANETRSVFGINSHIASRYPDFQRLDLAANAVIETNAGWAREEFQMHRIQPRRGEFDWGFNDKMVDLLTARGVQIVGVLFPAAGWATPFAGDAESEPSNYAPDPALFADFAARVVERYRDRITYWQIWNEPENATFWKPRPNAAEYSNLLRAVYPAIKRANPNAQVLSAGIVPFDQSFLRAIAVNDGWNSFDILAVHPYVDPNTPEAGQIDSAGIAAVKVLADTLGSKPIWVTEFGWSTGPSDRAPSQPTTEDNQANYLVRSAALMRAAGAERIIWYVLRDEGPNRNRYGLYNFGNGLTDFSQPKPALTAFRTLNRQLSNTDSARSVSFGNQQVVFDFENFGRWNRGDQPYGEFQPSSEQTRSGQQSGKLSYNFPGAGNDFVVFSPSPAINLPGSPSQFGAWVFGDGASNTLKVWLRDSQGEVLQFRLGAAGRGWSFLSTPINGPVEDFNRVSGSGNLRLDFPVSLVALVLDDDPDSFSGPGVLYIDDLTVQTGPLAYTVRFSRVDGVVDVIWAPGGGQVSIPTRVSSATLTDRNGGQQTITSSNGQFVINAGPSPVYLAHVPGDTSAPTPPPQPPAPGRCRDFPETGKQACGRILEYWEQNGGLPVFGYPITDQAQANVEGVARQVQMFERNRLELHPENAAPYDVLLGRLGDDVLVAQGRPWQEFPKRGDRNSRYYFEATGQSIAPEFVEYWSSNGLEFDGQPGKSFAESLALFGLPLSPPQTETNSSGDTVLTQWFERARFEYHPNNPAQFRVLLGLLGREVSGIR